jgi:hypothetical protein
MSSDMPDWLAGLVSAPEDENEDEDQFLAAPVRPQAGAVQPQAAMPQPQAAARPQVGAQMGPQVGVFEDGDMMADLRSQVTDEEIIPPSSAKRGRSRTHSRYVFGLLPWQVFFLSLLMFLDVAVIGMLFLVMLGRVVMPF